MEMSDPLGAARDFFNDHVRQRHGALLSGALAGVGVWAWLDALVTVPQKISFVNHVPGMGAWLALVVINSVRWDEIHNYDPWDEGVYCRSRTWLLFAYVLSGGAVAGAVAVMIGSSGGPIGVACTIQVAALLGAAMLFFVSRSEGEDGVEYGLL